MNQHIGKPGPASSAPSADPQRQIEQLQKLLDMSAEVICSCDAEGKLLFASAAVKEAWGYAPQELLGVSLINLIVPEDREKVQWQVEGAIKQTGSQPFQTRCIR